MKPQNQTTMIDKLAFETDDGLGATARFGIIVLQTDQTIEHEFAQLFTAKDIALYHARIPNAMEVSPDTLDQMKVDLPATAKLLPPSFSFNTIGYACTSGATMIGEDKVAEIIQEVHPQAKISNPLSASKAGLAALGVHQFALVTPYSSEVTLAMRDNFKKGGFNAIVVASFDQSDDFTVARISQQCVLDAILKAGVSDLCDGVFVSCTSLRTLDIISHAESLLGKPVVSSNQALAWHMMRLSGINHQPVGFGRLFTLR